MTDKDGKQKSIGECDCLYSDDKDNILVALDISTTRHKGILQDIENIKGFYEKSGIDPDNLIRTNKEMISRFESTRRKVAYSKLCPQS